jgi:phenylpropionate dioxygenase-like ring-hydroxylating dioxygenase large terminal subunit
VRLVTACNTIAQAHACASGPARHGARAVGYPAVERDRCIFVWTKHAPNADAAPQFPWMSRPGWQQTKLHAHIECNYQLIIDNLLDLSHLAFVHASTVGSGELPTTPS